MLQTRPIALTLIAAALLYAGLEAIVGMIGAISMGRINVNLAFLLLPAGIGLLRLSDGWRKFTLFCVCIAGLILLGLVAYEIIRPGQMPVTWFGSQTHGAPRYLLFVFIAGIGAAFLLWVFHTLTRHEIRSLFQSEAQNSASEPARE